MKAANENWMTAKKGRDADVVEAAKNGRGKDKYRLRMNNRKSDTIRDDGWYRFV